VSVLARIAVALALVLAAIGPAGAVERILNFISDVTVERNGNLAVTETIAVQAEGNDIRRGILRDFPTIYTRPDGSRVEVGFDVLSITRNGNPEDWSTERLSNGVRVRIGSANRLLNTGRHEYVIRYRTTRQIGFFRDYDELYWNATGNGWTFTIDQAEAHITLPEAVPFRQTAFYTGPQGASGRDATIVTQQPGRIVFRTTRALPPRNGFTVAAAWEKGIVTPPSGGQLARWWLADNVAVAVAVVGLLLVLGFYLYAWQRVGRDPPRGTIIPLFAPPAGMSAAAARYVHNLGFDQRCFTAAIIDAGVNGHLRIAGSDDKPVLEPRDGGKPVPPAESAMLGKLFGSKSKSSLTLSQANHGILGRAKTALSKGLEDAYLGKLFTNNFGWSGLGLLAVAMIIGLIVVSVIMSHSSDEAPGLVAGLVVPLLFIMGGTGLVYGGVQREPMSWWRIILGIVLVGVAALVGLVVTEASARGWIDFIPGIAAYIAAAIGGVGFSWLQAPSVEGRKVMDQIDGFRDYLGVAEEDRLNALNPPDKTPELFERFLPYAVALDVENAWAKRFAGVLAAAGAAAAANSWYTGNSDWSSDPVRFAEHLGSDLNQTIASASTPPGSTDSGGSSGGGSSGGGSSGGGGGGGGGSGW
jgi:uncharacterized membrane protein YgcG